MLSLAPQTPRTPYRSSSVTIVASQQGASVPRRLRHNSRLAPALLAGMAAAQLGLPPLPAGAATAAEQPSPAIDFLASAGDMVTAVQSKIGGSAALAFESFPSGLLASTAGSGGSGSAGGAPASTPASFRHKNEFGFCYSRVLCGARTASSGAPTAATQAAERA